MECVCAGISISKKKREKSSSTHLLPPDLAACVRPWHMRLRAS